MTFTSTTKQTAAVVGDISAIKDLATRGANPAYVNKEEGQRTPLHVAAEAGKPEALFALLSLGAPVDTVDGIMQATALHFACAKGQISAAKVLLQNGANVNAVNSYGNTALHLICSAEGKHTELVVLLLAHGADVMKRNKKGSTPLHFLCLNQSAHPSLLDPMLRAGADVEATDTRGFTPVLSCCMSGRADLLVALQQYGASLSAKDSEGRDAQSIAAFNGHLEKLNRHLMPA